MYSSASANPLQHTRKASAHDGDGLADLNSVVNKERHKTLRVELSKVFSPACGGRGQAHVLVAQPFQCQRDAHTEGARRSGRSV